MANTYNPLLHSWTKSVSNSGDARFDTETAHSGSDGPGSIALATDPQSRDASHVDSPSSEYHVTGTGRRVKITRQAFNQPVSVPAPAFAAAYRISSSRRPSLATSSASAEPSSSPPSASAKAATASTYDNPLTIAISHSAPAAAPTTSTTPGGSVDSTHSTPDLSSASSNNSGTFSHLSTPVTPRRNSAATETSASLAVAAAAPVASHQPLASLTRRSSSPRLAGQKIMPAQDRPVFQQQHDRNPSLTSSEGSQHVFGPAIRKANNVAPQRSNGSLRGNGGASTVNASPSIVSSSSSSSSSGRRQLMPSIPTRRTSAINDSASSASSTHQNSPNLGNQTNIQNLAQAIAARAQQVAATKAAAAAAAAVSTTEPNGTSQPAKGDVPVVAESNRASLNLGGPLTAVLSQNSRTPSIIDSVVSDYDVEDNGNANASLAVPPASQARANGGRGVRSDRDEVAQSFRWSQGDWADYAAALSQQIDVGTFSAVDGGSQSQDGVIVAAPSFSKISEARKSVVPAQPAPTSVNNAASLKGLGIQDPEQTTAKVSAPAFASPLFANIGKSPQASSTTPSDAIPNSASLASVYSNESTVTPATVQSTPSDSPPQRRKARPTPLSLSSVHSPSGSVTLSPSTSRSIASPSMGGRTPPPTMPPTEPLPPLPIESQSSAALRKVMNGQVGTPDGMGGQATPRIRHISGQSTHELQGFQNGKISEEERDRKRSSDPSDSRSFSHLPKGVGSDEYDADRNAGTHRKMSLPQSSISTASLAAQSVALAQANRASTMAERERAEAMLDDMQREPTYNQKMNHSRNASQSSASVHSSTHGRTHSLRSSNHSHSNLARAARQQASKAARAAGTTGSSTGHVDPDEKEQLQSSKQASAKPSSEENYDQEDEDANEAEEAVVTRAVTTTVKGARASLSRGPSLVIRGTASSKSLSKRKGSTSSTLTLEAPSGATAASAEEVDPARSEATQEEKSKVSRLRDEFEAREAGNLVKSRSQTFSKMASDGTTNDQSASPATKKTLSTPDVETSTPASDSPIMPATLAVSNDGADNTKSAVSTAATARPGKMVRRTSSTQEAPPSAWSGNGAPIQPSLNLATQPQRVTVSSIDPAIGARSPSAASIHGQTGSWTPSMDTPSIAGGGYENPNALFGDSTPTMGDARDSILHSGATSVAADHSLSQLHARPFSGLQNRRGEMNEDSRSASTESPIDRIKRTEGRFAGAFGEVALAFKHLQAEKRALEKVVRATTPLDGLGHNGDSLGEYLTTMSVKVEASAQEIKKLLDLMDQQRSVMDYMADTHRLELQAANDEVEELRDDFDDVCDEADTHRANAIRLTEELDKAQHDAIAARAETLRYKATLQEEEARKAKTMKLLRTAREDLSRLERERDEAQSTLRSTSSSSSRSFHENAAAKTSSAGGHSARSADGESHDGDSALLTNESSSSSLLERISVLEKDLHQANRMNGELQRQLGEQQSTLLKDFSPSSADRSMSLPDADELERERDALRDKLFQQEKDIAELRAQIALGAISGATLNGSDPNAIAMSGTPAGLPAAREDQVKLLMAQMTEQRAREAQIRKAYRQVRDDLRKMHSAQQHDRRRMSFLVNGPVGLSTQNSASSLSANPLNAALNATASPTSYTASTDTQSLLHESAAAPQRLHGAATEGSTPRHLKRLSLPLVNKMSATITNAGGAAPPSSFVPVEGRRPSDGGPSQSPTSSIVRLPNVRPASVLASNGGTAPIFTSSRRNSRTLSVDFSSAAGGNKLRAGTDVSPRMQAHRQLFGHGGEADGDAAGDQTEEMKDDEGIEQLRTPRQSMAAE